MKQSPAVRSFACMALLLFGFLNSAGCSGTDANDVVTVEQPQPVVLQPSTLPSTIPSPSKSASDVNWGYQKNALTVDIYTQGKLNEYNGLAHTLMLCMYQLSAQKEFAQLSNSLEGLEKLLECEHFSADVVSTKRIFVQPEGNQTIEMDRDEGAKFLGIAAGYYDLAPGKVTRSYEFPINVNETGMLWWSEKEYTPAKLKVEILLGPNSMQTVRRN